MIIVVRRGHTPSRVHKTVRDLFEIRVVPLTAIENEPSHTLRLQELTHCERRRGAGRTKGIEDELGVAREGLAIRMPIGRGREELEDVVGQGEEVHAQRGQDRLQGVTLLVCVDDGERRLSITLQGVSIIRTAQTLGCGAELEAVVHVERQEHVLEVRKRLAVSDGIRPEVVQPDVTNANLELKVVNQVGAVVPYAGVLMGCADEVVVRVAHVDEPFRDALVCDLS